MEEEDKRFRYVLRGYKLNMNHDLCIEKMATDLYLEVQMKTPEIIQYKFRELYEDKPIEEVLKIFKNIMHIYATTFYKCKSYYVFPKPYADFALNKDVYNGFSVGIIMYILEKYGRFGNVRCDEDKLSDYVTKLFSIYDIKSIIFDSIIFDMDECFISDERKNGKDIFSICLKIC